MDVNRCIERVKTKESLRMLRPQLRDVRVRNILNPLFHLTHINCCNSGHLTLPTGCVGSQNSSVLSNCIVGPYHQVSSYPLTSWPPGCWWYGPTLDFCKSNAFTFHLGIALYPCWDEQAQPWPILLPVLNGIHRYSCFEIIFLYTVKMCICQGTFWFV